jgi:hypothetical protein
MATILTDKSSSSTESAKEYKVGTILTDQPTETTDSSDTTIATLLAPTTATPTRRLGPSRRLGYVVGGLVATVAAAAIFVSTVLPTSTPKTIGTVQTASTATLPPMSNSMGFWDFVSYPKPALPPMSNDMGFWDRIQAPSHAALPPMSNDMGFWDRIQAPSHAALPPMSNDMGFWDRIQAPSHAQTLPPMSNSMGFWDFVSYPTTASR